jgi:hypothetical protein
MEFNGFAWFGKEGGGGGCPQNFGKSMEFFGFASFF